MRIGRRTGTVDWKHAGHCLAESRRSVAPKKISPQRRSTSPPRTTTAPSETSTPRFQHPPAILRRRPPLGRGDAHTHDAEGELGEEGQEARRHDDRHDDSSQDRADRTREHCPEERVDDQVRGEVQEKAADLTPAPAPFDMNGRATQVERREGSRRAQLE